MRRVSDDTSFPRDRFGQVGHPLAPLEGHLSVEHRSNDDNANLCVPSPGTPAGATLAATSRHQMIPHSNQIRIGRLGELVSP